MEASDSAKLVLFLQSVMYDLGIPQDAATLLYEDNDACCNMANAHKAQTHYPHPPY